MIELIDLMDTVFIFSRPLRSLWEMMLLQLCQSFFSKTQLLRAMNPTCTTLLVLQRNPQVRYQDYRKHINSLSPLSLHPPIKALSCKGEILETIFYWAMNLSKDIIRTKLTPDALLKLILWRHLLVLRAIDVPKPFVLWIKQCITWASYSININGGLEGHISRAKGVRQGCPLSPIFFVKAIEGFSQLYNSAALRGELECHPACKKLGLAHLGFADDLWSSTKCTSTSHSSNCRSCNLCSVL